MGLGIAFGAPVTSGQTAYAPGGDKVFIPLAEAAETLATERGIGLFHNSYEADSRLYLELYPQAEPIEFFADDGHIVVWAKTSTAGPGYHIFLIEFLEELGRRCGLAWIFDDEQREYADEAEYLPERDIETVHSWFARWLMLITDDLLMRDSTKGFRLSLSKNMQPEAKEFACSPLGYWPRSYFEELSTKSGRDLVQHACAFFPWWNAELDADFWRNTGISMLWTDVRWHPPTDQAELDSIALPLSCFENATRIEPNIRLPEPEIAFLLQLLDYEGDSPPVPSPNGIGFWRGLMAFSVTGHWIIEVPGYYYNDAENDRHTAVIWHCALTIRGSSMTLESRLSDRPERDVYAKLAGFMADQPDDEPTDDKSQPIETITLSKEGLTGLASLYEEGDGHEKSWCIQAIWEHQTEDLFELCILTIDLNGLGSKGQALQVINSIRFSPPKPTVTIISPTSP